MAELREKVKEAILDAWGSYDIADDMDAVADAILAIPEIAEALAARRIITPEEARAQMRTPPNV